MIPFLIAKNTMKEIIRDRVLYGLLLFAIFLIIVSLLLGELSFSQQGRIITNLGLLAVDLGCGMLAIFVGSSLVWRELEKQTVLTLLSKPVSRVQFLLGKYLGLALILLLVDVIISLLLGFIYYKYDNHFWFQFIVAQWGTLLKSLFLLTTAIFFGVFCRPLLTTLFTFSVWLLSNGVSDLHYFSNKSQNETIKFVGTTIARIFPNFENFDFKEAVIYGDPILNEQIIRAGVIWVAWFAILFIATTWIFKRRDFI